MKYRKESDNKILIPSMVVLGLIPLIMHVFYYNCKLSQFDWFPNNSDQMSDYFLGWKMVAIIIVGAVMLGIMLFRYFRKKEKFIFENSFYALLIYGFFVGMSALFSNYKYWVNVGSHQVFESVWVLFAYMIFCYYTYQYVKSEQQVVALLKWGAIGCLILMIIGMTQFIGIDFFQTAIGKMLITNPSSWGGASNLNFNTPKHVVYATLYNQNYLSFYFGLLIPIILALIIASKKLVHRIILAIIEIFAGCCLIGAQSASGWLALGASFFITIIVLASRKKKNFIITLCALALCVVVGIIACVATPLGNKVNALFRGTAEFPALKAIDTTDSCVQMDIDGNILKVSYDVDENTNEVAIHTTDENGEILNSIQKEDDPTISVIQNDGYRNCEVSAIMLNDQLGVSVTLDEHSWYFTKDDNNGYVLVNQAAKLELYKSEEFSTLFRDDAVSGRGHIWDGIIPRLSKYIFVGNGANTFIFAYPQNDYIYRAYYDIPNVLDVKAHSIYLQQWVENGMFAMIAFIVFYVWYAVTAIRILRRADMKNQLSLIELGIFTGTLTYMIVGLANDSNVCTAPGFWIMLGLGMAVNRIIKASDLNIAEIIKKETVDEVCETSTVRANSNSDKKGKKQSRKARKKSGKK